MRFNRKTAIVVTGLVVVSCTSFAQVADVSVLGVANITHKSFGEIISGPSTGILSEQSSRAATGLSVEYSWWWGNNAGSFAYTISPTDSKLISKQGGRDQWAITRNELDLSWIHRLRSGRVEPFIQGGFGAIVLNGAIASGLDHQFPLIAGAGADIRVSSRMAFRYGLSVGFLRASNFSDPTYKGGRTFILQPKFGLVWKFGSRPRRMARKKPTVAPAG